FGARASFLSGQNLGMVILGRVLEPAALGYFKFAFQMVERFVELVHTIPTSLLPSLTHLVAREEYERLRNVFDQAFRLVQLVGLVLSFVLFAYARELTLWLGSPLFEPAVPVLRVLALVPIVRTAQQPLTMLFQALRRPGMVLALALVKLLTEVGGYLLLLPALGVMGAAWANLGGATASYLGALALMFVALPLGASSRLSDAARGILLIVPILLLVLAADRIFGPVHSLPVRLVLLVPGLVGVFAFGFIRRFDLDKVSTLPLRSEALKRVRDQVVRGASTLARVFEPRRAA
ncbi:MAG: oligosaccharide flippase family protein, partial [Candidatus Eisenbacteria bacterium]